MSLSRRVDLTIGRDFSDTLSRLPILSRETIDLVNEIDQAESSPFIDSTRYNVLSARERIFGEKSLKNRAHAIFYSDKEQRFNEETRTHCHRCGIEIRAPWKNKGCLCERCGSDLEQDNYYNRVPWKRNGEIGERDTTMDIFEMR